MSAAIRIALIGTGKIARDQHLPVIADDPAFALVATVDPGGSPVPGAPAFADIAALATSGVAVDAVAICTPPQARAALAAAAIAQGWHVFLEKPPAATLAEVAGLEAAAGAARVTLYASWHSRHAPGVAPARAWLADRELRRVTVTWREDVRVWHPGQDWIWKPGGFGVFDPGINALSIVTALLPRPLSVREAVLDLPENCAAPIAARVTLGDDAGLDVAMDLDFRQEGPQHWTIEVETDAGTLRLANGGADLILPGQSPAPAERDRQIEYRALYRQFADLARRGASDVDIAPLRLVADSFLRARFRIVEPFHDRPGGRAP